MGIKLNYLLVFIAIIFLAILAFVANQWYSYKNQISVLDDNSFNFEILNLLSENYSSLDKHEYSISDLVLWINTLNEKSYQHFYHDLNLKLTEEPGQFGVKYLSDSNAVAFYSIGFDKTDDRLEKYIYTTRSVSFIDYLFKKKGDILILLYYPPSLCEDIHKKEIYFKSGKTVLMKDSLTRVVILDSLTKLAHKTAQFDYKDEFTLYKLQRTDSNNFWEYFPICPENKRVSDPDINIIQTVNLSNLSEYLFDIDSIYMPVYSGW